MTAPQIGDRIRVTYEATWTRMGDGEYAMVQAEDDPNDQWHNIVPRDAAIEILPPGPRTADIPVSTAPAAAAHPLVKGRCPACNGASLFLGAGGYVTCARLDCPGPTAADDLLHRGRTTPSSTLTAQLHKLVEEEMYAYRERTGFWPEGGVTTEIARLAARGALEAITAHLEFGPEDSWCKACRRVWTGPSHRCESDAEQRLARVRELHHATCLLATGKVQRPAFSCEVCDTLDGVTTPPAATKEQP